MKTLRKKNKNLLDIFADGQITKEEFSEMRKSYDEQINAFNEQKKLLSERNEQYSRCFDSLSCISKALSDMIDISNDMVRSKLLDKFLVSVVPDNGRYNWNYKLSEYDQASQILSVEGNKRHPNIIIEKTSESEESDDDSSDIHNICVSDFKDFHLWMCKSNPHKRELHRQEQE